MDGTPVRPGHVLSHSLASIEQACSGMQVTIAHQRGPLSRCRDSMPATEKPEAVDFDCARVHSLCSSQGRTIDIRREFYTARSGVETPSDRSMEWWLFGQSSDGLWWVHDITLAIRHRRIANVWPRSDRSVSFRKEDLADAFDPFDPFEHSAINVLPGLFDLYRSHRSTASPFRLEFMN